MRSLIIAALYAFVLSSPAAAFERGDWVLGQWKGGQYWYPGVVQGSSNGRISIVYDDGDVETRSFDQVQAYNWRPGSRVECNFKNAGKWYPGKIAALDGEFLQISYDDGDRERTKTGRCRSR